MTLEKRSPEVVSLGYSVLFHPKSLIFRRAQYLKLPHWVNFHISIDYWSFNNLEQIVIRLFHRQAWRVQAKKTSPSPAVEHSSKRFPHVPNSLPTWSLKHLFEYLNTLQYYACYFLPFSAVLTGLAYSWDAGGVLVCFFKVCNAHVHVVSKFIGTWKHFSFPLLRPKGLSAIICMAVLGCCIDSELYNFRRNLL